MNPTAEQLAAIIVTAAREELLPRFASATPEQKADGSLVTDADREMQARLTATLARHWPDIPLLGEEMPAEEQARLMDSAANGLWLLDPLDGTSNFAVGLPFFAVSLALVRGGRPVLGLVYDPVRDECFSAEAGAGARLNGAPLSATPPPLPLERGIGIVDFKRLDRALACRIIEERPFASQRNLGAAALEWCMLAAGRAHVYLHGGQKPWDYAAGSLILAEAGGEAVSLDGTPVIGGPLQPRAVAAASAELFDQWRGWLGI